TIQGADEPGPVGGVAFVGYEGALDSDVWAWNGSSVTNLQINPTGGSQPAELTSFDGAVYFSATNATGDTELWRYDGSTLSEINVNSTGSSSPDLLTVVNGSLYFRGVGDDGGSHLWRYDGSDLSQITALGSYQPEELEAGNGLLYVSADFGSDTDLWV